MKDRKIDQEFDEQTMPLARTLPKLEKDGTPVDGARLEQLPQQMLLALGDLPLRYAGISA
jgi:hypothetical protein